MKSTDSSSRSTLHQVANLAGVSPTTASLVLGGKAGKHRISDETYARVKQAAEQLDYAPNLLVRSLQAGRTGIISFYNAFRHRSVNDLYMDRLSMAVEIAGGRRGYDILVHCNFCRSPEETYRFLNGGRADGLLLFAPLADDPLLPLLRRSRLPVVLLNAEDEEQVLPSVRDDYESGMRQIVQTMLKLGHRSFTAVVEDSLDSREAHLRARLMQKLLLEEGTPHHFQMITFDSDHLTALNRLMGETPRPTALFCWRDWLAYRLLECCDQLQIRVPEQLSIIGYDGLRWPAATRHTVASVSVDLELLADKGVQLLDDSINNRTEGWCSTRLPVLFQNGTTLGPSCPCDIKERDYL